MVDGVKGLEFQIRRFKYEPTFFWRHVTTSFWYPPTFQKRNLDPTVGELFGYYFSLAALNMKKILKVQFHEETLNKQRNTWFVEKCTKKFSFSTKKFWN